MLLDKQNIFSDAQTIVSTCYSSNCIKFGKGDVSFVPVIIQVVEDFTGLTSLTVEFETSETANFAQSVSLGSSVLLLANLKAGARYPVAYLPKGNLGYMRLKYVIAGSCTGGKITAGVVNNNQPSWHDM